MNDFVTQFLPQIMPIIIFLVICIALLVAIQVMLYKLRKKRQREKRAAIAAMGTVKEAESAKKSAIVEEEMMPILESELDDDPLTELHAAAQSLDDDDPLAELHAAAQSLDDEPSPEILQEDEADDPLAELYAAREEAVEEVSTTLGALLEDKTQQSVATYTLPVDPVSISLNSGQIVQAQEKLCVLRDQADKRLMILTKDMAYRTLIHDSSAKEQFSSLMKELSGVILKADENPPAQDTGEEDELSSLLATMGQAPLYRVPKEEVTVAVSDGGTSVAQPLLSILRDESDGRLLILAGKKGYRTLFGEDKVKKGFTGLMKELSSVILTEDDRVVPSEPAPSQKQQAATVAEHTVPKTEGQAKKLADELEPLPGDLPDLTLPDNPDNYNVGRFGRVSIKRVDRAPEINIAEAIGDYVQYKISVSPEFQNRGIHIRPSITGGIRIEADGQYYDFVDEVADEAVRSFLQQCINEWQERH